MDFSKVLSCSTQYAGNAGSNNLPDFIADIVPDLVTLSGAATSSSSSTTITGSAGSSFLTELKAGDAVYLDGSFMGMVNAVSSNTVLTLTNNALSSATNAVKIQKFSAKLIRPDQKLLVFPTNYRRVRKIRGDTVSNPDNSLGTTYTITKTLIANMDNGVATFDLDPNEEFQSTSDIGNYIVVSGTTGNQLLVTSSILQLSNSNRTVTIGSGCGGGVVPI